eukprot:165945-Amphidinium_carterae.1
MGKIGAGVDDTFGKAAAASRLLSFNATPPHLKTFWEIGSTSTTLDAVPIPPSKADGYSWKDGRRRFHCTMQCGLQAVAGTSFIVWFC